MYPALVLSTSTKDDASSSLCLLVVFLSSILLSVCVPDAVALLQLSIHGSMGAIHPVSLSSWWSPDPPSLSLGVFPDPLLAGAFHPWNHAVLYRLARIYARARAKRLLRTCGCLVNRQTMCTLRGVYPYAMCIEIPLFDLFRPLWTQYLKLGVQTPYAT